MSRGDALHVEPHLVVEIIGQRQDHLLAGPRQREEGKAEGLVAAGGDADILGRDGRTIEIAHVAGECRAQRRQPQDVGIARTRRLADDRRQMIGQRRRRGIARHRLGHIDQRLFLGKAPPLDPAMGFGDGRWCYGAQQRVESELHGRLLKKDEPQRHRGTEKRKRAAQRPQELNRGPSG